MFVILTLNNKWNSSTAHYHDILFHASGIFSNLKLVYQIVNKSVLFYQAWDTF